VIRPVKQWASGGPSTAAVWPAPKLAEEHLASMPLRVLGAREPERPAGCAENAFDVTASGATRRRAAQSCSPSGNGYRETTAGAVARCAVAWRTRAHDIMCRTLPLVYARCTPPKVRGCAAAAVRMATPEDALEAHTPHQADTTAAAAGRHAVAALLPVANEVGCVERGAATLRRVRIAGDTAIEPQSDARRRQAARRVPPPARRGRTRQEITHRQLCAVMRGRDTERRAGRAATQPCGRPRTAGRKIWTAGHRWVSAPGA